MFTITRSEYNPILSPLEKLPWEAMATFNGCPIEHKGETYLVYRAMSEPDLIQKRSSSVIGITTIEKNAHGKRFEFIKPDTDFDKYGCEDPRITKVDDTFFIFYTALGGFPFSAENIKVAVALSDDLQTIKEKHLVTPFNAKAMAMFDRKVNGKYAALLTINTDIGPSEICYAEFEKKEDIWSTDFWNNWWQNRGAHTIQVRREDSDQIELGAPPIFTEKGWLIVYSHIQKYGKPDQVFGIEFILLDKDNPKKIIGRTRSAFMVPEEYYEKVGQIPNIIFPSGALLRNDVLEIYYGAADTYCAVAYAPIKPILKYLVGESVGLERFARNPIIAPRSGFLWEEGGTLNPAAIDLGGKTHILYRATTRGNVSTIGYANTHDGFTISERLDKPIYFARENFEVNPGHNENYGCEDPRIVEIGDRLYMTYTAYNGNIPRVAVSSISKEDFLNKKWQSWSKPEAVTPANIDNKDATIVPERINDKYLFIHRVNDSICGQFISSLDFSKVKINLGTNILRPRKGMWDGVKVGISGPPIKTEKGWLLLYHGVSATRKYRVGAVLLDPEDPTIVRSRTAVPIFEPEAIYEKNGLVPNVVFPCSLVKRNDILYVYYGGGDSVVGVATIKEKNLLDILETPNKKLSELWEK